MRLPQQDDPVRAVGTLVHGRRGGIANLPDFEIYVDPITTRGVADYAHHNIICPPLGFSDLPPALSQQLNLSSSVRAEINDEDKRVDRNHFQSLQANPKLQDLETDSDPSGV